MAQEICNRCRILALSLVPMDNKDLDWTVEIYADSSVDGKMAPNLPLWNADVDALLEVSQSRLNTPDLTTAAGRQGGLTSLVALLLHVVVDDRYWSHPCQALAFI